MLTTRDFLLSNDCHENHMSRDTLEDCLSGTRMLRLIIVLVRLRVEHEVYNTRLRKAPSQSSGDSKPRRESKPYQAHPIMPLTQHHHSHVMNMGKGHGDLGMRVSL